MSEIIHMRVDPELKSKIQKEAAKNYQPVTQWILNLVRVELSKNKKKDS